MKNRLNNIISLCSRRTLLFCTFLLSAGLFTGIFFSMMIPDNEESYLLSALQMHLKSSEASFSPFLLSNIILILAIIIFSISIYAFPLCFAVLFTKAVSIGFCGRLLLSHQISTSAVSFLLEFLIPNIITAALLLFLTAITVSYSHSRLKKVK